MSSRGPELSNPRAFPFFDQGLFLLHLNRGKEEMRRGEYDMARRELETALRLRQQDPEVLSNLSFTLFHLGHYEEAERMTRELLMRHSDSVPLLFNLGLILYKSGQESVAKEPLQRVLALAPGHRKAHLTMGLVLQKLGDTELARRHFRLAGTGATGDGDDTLSRAARRAVQDGAAEENSVKPDKLDTQEVLPLRRPPPAVEPVKPVEPAVPEPSDPTPLPLRLPILTAGAFTTKPGGFLAADCRPGLYLRRGALTGRTGSPALDVDRALTGTLAQLLIRASGQGTVLLVSRGRHAYLEELGDEFLSVEPARLLGFEASLSFREDPAFEFRRQISSPFLKLFGTGTVALAVTSEPARFDVAAGEPLTIAARAVVAYGGDLTPDLMEDIDPLAELGAGPVFRFTGDGFVLADAG